MHSRLVIIFSSSLLCATTTWADSAKWACEQDKNSQEWVCSGDEKKEISPSVQSEPEKITQPDVNSQKKVVEEKIEQDNLPSQFSPEKKTEIEKTAESVENETPKVIKPQKTIATKTTNSGLGLLNPAFDAIQEQTFLTLQSQLTVNPWQNCSIDSNAKVVMPQVNKALRNRSALDVKSNYSEIFENEISSYFGNVEINRADQHSFSDAASYDSVSETLNLQGDVYYSDDAVAVHSNSATLELANDHAKLRDVLFISPSTPFRGHAESVYRENKSVSHYKEVAYTSCPPNNQDWVIHAEELNIDKDAGEGTARNAWLEFKGTPVVYSPYLAFPTDNRRLSGFLAPSFGNTSRAGFNVSVPYYWNIAPNYDATFKPRYLTKRGIMLTGEGRYLTEMSRGIVNLELLPQDLREDKTRYLLGLKNTAQFTSHLSSSVDLNYVSDKNYFAELGSALSIPNFSFLHSNADIAYQRDGIEAVARIENYQSTDPALKKEQLPYRRLPQVNVNLNHTFQELPIKLAMENEFVYFQHNQLMNGQRSNLKPSVSLPLKTDAAYVTPKVSFQYTQYFLSKPLSSTIDDSKEISRTLPIFSTDSGMTFERSFNLANNAFSQTIEPRLFYLYIPNSNQNDIPQFDTTPYDVWFDSLFRENRFSGLDRMQDANQLTAALTSRLIDSKTGKERLKFSIGDIIYFQDREVASYIYDTEGNVFYLKPETNTFSNLVSEFSGRINDHVAFSSGIQWNPYNEEISRGKVMLHLTNRPNEIFNVGYRYRQVSNPNIDYGVDKLTGLAPQNTTILRDGISQTDVSAQWPVYDNWSVIGRWQYSWLYNSTQESFLGVEKENCCWRFRIIGRRYINNLNLIGGERADAQGVSQTGVFFQVELKGLTGIGEKLDDFLEQNIYGYRKPN